MNILVLGANGKVGSKVAAKLLENGHTVTAGVHKNVSHVPAGIRTVTIDITDLGSIATALEGIDVVACALSTWAAPDKQIISTAMQSLIPAMDAARIKRIVSISGNVARVPNEKTGIFIRLFHTFKFGVLRKVVEDSEKHITMLAQSDLEWTIIRPGVMTSANRPPFTFRSKPPLNPFVTRAAVVASIVELVENNSHIHEAPFVINQR